MSERNIKLILEYDGSAFFGFQRQPKHPTIQEALEKALSKILNKKTKIAAASGRTDTGVHALGQVVNFKTESERTLSEIKNGLNAFLPKPVAVKRVEEVSKNFHARYSAKSKTYEYRIWNSSVRSPLEAGRAWHVWEPLDIKLMKRAAKILCSRHDFKAFCAADNAASSFPHALRRESDPRLTSCGDDESQLRSKLRVRPLNTVRTIKNIQIKSDENLIWITIEADGFLYHMARNIVGTLVEVGKGKLKVEDVRNILTSCDRRKAGAPAPAQGLTLICVTY